MNLTANETAGWTWPEVILVLGLIFIAVTLVFGAAAAWLEVRRPKLLAQQEDNLRQLVSRYEQLAENTLEAQQRVAADVSELRSRAGTIEQILRTVDQC